MLPQWQFTNTHLDGGRNPERFSVNFGLSFETRITRHSGIETGFYYRNVRFPSGVAIYPPATATPYPSAYQRYFSIPLVYKYYSRIINAGVGVTYDFMFDHTTISVNSKGKEQDKHRFGVIAKVSKDITLYRGLMIEPEFHFNPFCADGDWEKYWLGFSVGLKYRF